MKNFKLVKIAIVPILIGLGLIVYNFVLKNKDFAYVGTVEATKIEISARVSSVIAKMNAREGRYVKQGDLLVELSCEDIKNSFETLDKDYQRAVRLQKSGALSQENYDHILSKRNESKIKHDWCSITSNIDGKILNVFREESEYVNPGTKLLTLANLKEVWAIIYVPQNLYSTLKTGQSVTGIIPELDNKDLPGEITYISDVAEFTPKNVQTREERTRLIYAVKVTFQNPDEILKPGMSIEVRLEK